MITGGLTTTLIKWSLPVALAMAAPCRADAAIFRLLVLGDSIGAGYGLAPQQSFPAQLAQDLPTGVSVDIIDDSVSGDTSAGGLARVGDALGRRPDALLLELGANDALRGVDPNVTYANLDRILSQCDTAHVPVLILGMKAPANWGHDYQTRFDAVFPHLAKAHHALLYPFLLDGVALDPAFNQADLLHPNAAGAALIARHLVPDVIRLISERKKAP